MMAHCMHRRPALNQYRAIFLCRPTLGVYETAVNDAGLNIRKLRYSIKMFSHLKLCLATAIHNFK